MTEQDLQGPMFAIEIPAELGGGTIAEQEYLATPGTRFLVDEMLGVAGVHEKLAHRSLINDIKQERHDYLADVVQGELGHEVMRAFHSTDALISDQYDIAEALRLTDPTAALIEANVRLNKDMATSEANFLVKRDSLGKLHAAISTELDLPYRQKEAVDTEQVKIATPMVEGAYEIEDEVIASVDASNRSAVRMAIHDAVARHDNTGPKDNVFYTYLGEIDSDVIAFYEGAIPRIDFHKISMAHTIASAAVKAEMMAGSPSAKISALAAASPDRKFAWSGDQVEYDVAGFGVTNVFTGGDVSQN